MNPGIPDIMKLTRQHIQGFETSFVSYPLEIHVENKILYNHCHVYNEGS
jgi:hypothetical protein